MPHAKFNDCRYNENMVETNIGIWNSLQQKFFVFEPSHEEMCLYVNNKGADQPVHPCSLISAFVVCCLDSIISLDAIAKISRL